jgi:hypothetical protein
MSRGKRHWFIRRVALGLAVAAVAAPVAQARVDEHGIAKEQAIQVASASNGFVPGVSDFGKGGTIVRKGDYGMPRAMPSDYARERGDQIELVRAAPRADARGYEHIELVRTQPRSAGTPEAVAAPGIDWSDAGIGAGLMAALVALGGGALVFVRRTERPQVA